MYPPETVVGETLLLAPSDRDGSVGRSPSACSEISTKTGRIDADNSDNQKLMQLEHDTKRYTVCMGDARFEELAAMLLEPNAAAVKLPERGLLFSFPPHGKISAMPDRLRNLKPGLNRIWKLFANQTTTQQHPSKVEFLSFFVSVPAPAASAVVDATAGGCGCDGQYWARLGSSLRRSRWRSYRRSYRRRRMS